MTVWRVEWCQALRNEHTDHDTEAAAAAAEDRLRRAGIARVTVYRVEVTYD